MYRLRPALPARFRWRGEAGGGTGCGMTKVRRTLVVDVATQTLALREGRRVVARYPVSTSRFGLGCGEGTFRTPTGRFAIHARIGGGSPWGTIFKGRKPVGIWSPGPGPGGDLILTRILWLDGLGRANANTRGRFIYLHGTNHEEAIGTPASCGCVRLRNDDMIELFGRVRKGDAVRIVPPPREARRAPVPEKSPQNHFTGR